MAADLSLPDSSSPDLILALPTPDEKKKIWSSHFQYWGRNLTHEGYMGREEFMLNAPVNQNGVFTIWILTTATAAAAAAAAAAADETPASERPILASCETYRKKAIMKGADGVVRDVCGYGIGSVFTFTDFRRRGYASTMMALLRDHLSKLHQESGASPCSILYSDIGREFYAKSGWIAQETTSYLEFPIVQDDSAVIANGVGHHPSSAMPIVDADVPAFAEIDEALLRRQLSGRTSSNNNDAKDDQDKKTQIAFLPNAETHRWHFLRDDFYYNLAFSRTPTVRGAVYSTTTSSGRVWAIWTGVHYGGLENIQNNILCVNRFVIEDESISDDELSHAIKAILSVAAKEAMEWRLTKIHMWNPSERIKTLCAAAKLQDLNSRFVIREKDSLPSLNWFGSETRENVEWVANERYTWC